MLLADWVRIPLLTGNMVPDPSGSIAGALPPWNGMQRFRDRMLRAYGFAPDDTRKVGSVTDVNAISASADEPWEAGGRRKQLKVIFVHNKRFDLEDRMHINAAILR